MIIDETITHNWNNADDDSCREMFIHSTCFFWKKSGLLTDAAGSKERTIEMCLFNNSNCLECLETEREADRRTQNDSRLCNTQKKFEKDSRRPTTSFCLFNVWVLFNNMINQHAAVAVQ